MMVTQLQQARHTRLHKMSFVIEYKAAGSQDRQTRAVQSSDSGDTAKADWLEESGVLAAMKASVSRTHVGSHVRNKLATHTARTGASWWARSAKLQQHCDLAIPCQLLLQHWVAAAGPTADAMQHLGRGT